MKNWTTEIKGKEVTLRCQHAAEWPPLHIKLGELEVLRATGVVDDHKYEQIKTWQRVCGLSEMAEKCLTCPLVRHEEGEGPGRAVHFPPFARSRAKKV